MQALQSFQKVLDLENGEKGEWGFKALKQMIKINFKLLNYGEMMVRYKQLLTYIKSAVTRNHSEKSINSILDYISTSKNVSIVRINLISAIRLIHQIILLTNRFFFVSFYCLADLVQPLQMELLQNFYETTLDALKDAKNDRLWFKTNTKLGKLYFDRNDFTKLQKILKQLHQSCQVY